MKKYIRKYVGLLCLLGIFCISGLGCRDSKKTSSQSSSNRVVPRSSTGTTVIAAIGDSITWGALALGAKADSGGYPLILESQLRAAGYEAVVINKGLPGEKAFQTHERFPYAIADADIVLLMIGTNDIIDPESCPKPNGCRTADHIAAMIETASQADVLLVLSTIPPAQPNCARSWANPAVQALNAQIRAIAREYHLPLIDTHQTLQKYGGKFFSDCLHLTDEGYEIIAEQWYSVLIETQQIKHAKIGSRR